MQTPGCDFVQGGDPFANPGPVTLCKGATPLQTPGCDFVQGGDPFANPGPNVPRGDVILAATLRRVTCDVSGDQDDFAGGGAALQGAVGVCGVL